jgi:hypothetical protein
LDWGNTVQELADNCTVDTGGSGVGRDAINTGRTEPEKLKAMLSATEPKPAKRALAVGRSIT